ncbi:MAG: FAD-dependent oxidoreductase, partial [Mariprofundaceae bacterium]|nr:FAD-dependent oxidoreductase [Mariprofundaceae bacterium]
MRAGIIGGGLCGLTAAIRLAQRGVEVDVFEAAPSPGGRTRSFFDSRIGQWVDNGPHLLSGAYHQTIQLLSEAAASEHIDWQDSLNLPLWDVGRGHFQLHPNPSLPLALSLPWACAHLPGHGWDDIPALLRLAGLLKRPVDDAYGVEDWMHAARIPQALLRDLLEPMCLGAMNESWQ